VTYSETPGAEELADATEAPYEPQYDKRTFDYLAREEKKSRNRSQRAVSSGQ
jgi:hypothetical protein